MFEKEIKVKSKNHFLSDKENIKIKTLELAKFIHPQQEKKYSNVD